MSAFVYVLTHKMKPRFKIGKAIDIPARMAQLMFDEFDLDTSFALRVETEAAALNLERALHRCFSKWRLSPEAVLSQEGARFTGYTEWFGQECFDLLRNFVSQNAELFDYTRVDADELQALVKKAQTAALAPTQKSPKKRKPDYTVTPDHIRDAEATAHRLLPLLFSLTEYCDSLTSVEHCAGVRELRGTCTAENAEKVARLLQNLFELGRFDFGFGGFNLFGYIGLESHKHGGLRFVADHLWPVDSGSCSAPSAAARRELARLPLTIEGWNYSDPENLRDYLVNR